MLSVSPAVCESRLTAHLTKAAKTRRGDTVSLIEIVDEAALWDDPFTDLTPALCALDFETLMTRFPALGCAAAAEIGFRFEGVGTIFWARFEELIGSAIPVSRRSMLADSYDRLAGRFPIQRPAETGFNEHFSIIAWPIANALMPAEVAAPLARLLSRGPSWTGSITARRTDLSALRAWARSWEGIRLSEWLQNEAVAGRVVAALLGDNSQGLLNEASFRRVIGAYTRQSEAFFALRDAKRRRQNDSTKGAGEIDEGLLSLRRIGGHYALTVTWSPVPHSLLETARSEASGLGWRPRLWGQGSPQHSDQAFGSLPVLLNLNHIPSYEDTAFPTADETFGKDSSVAGALRARRVDWAEDYDFGAPGDAWRCASERAQLSALGSPLLRLIAPTRGAEVLARRPFVSADLAETATFLADWTTAWCLPRSQISKELACSSLQVWLSPGAADTDAAVRQMARDTFLARAVRYVALRMAA